LLPFQGKRKAGRQARGMNEFFEKNWGDRRRRTNKSRFLPKTPNVHREKISKQGVQLLLDKVGDLIYLHKIFQHLSVGVAGNDNRAENLSAPETAPAERLESINNTATGVENWLIISPPRKGIVRTSCNGFAIAPTRAR